MMKRSVFLALAAGLIASVAFSAQAQAGSTLVTTIGVFSLSSGTTTEIDFFYQDHLGNPLLGISGPFTTIDTGTLTTITYTPIGTSEVKVTFDPKSATDGVLKPISPGLEFTFMSSNAAGDVFLKQMQVVVSPSVTVAQAAQVTSGAIPEPASLALLGIGMTGFLAFRRFFKKTAVA